MAKSSEIAKIEQKSAGRTFVDLSVAPSFTELALELFIDLRLPPDELVRKAAETIDLLEKFDAGVGIALLQAKTKCQHGEFEKFLDSYGIPRQRAAEHMRLAELLANTPSEQRIKLLHQPKKVRLGLASMDPKVREHWFETGELDEPLTINEYKAQLARKDKELLRLEGQLAQREGRELVEAQGHIISTRIPFQISDVRREGAALVKQAELAIASLADLPAVLLGLQDVDKAEPWMQPTANQLYLGMNGLMAQLLIHMQGLQNIFDLAAAPSLPAATDLAFFQPEEAPLVAKHFAQLTSEHLAQGLKREKQRGNEKPGKLGRNFKVD